jgi:hypothetical protein
MIEPGKRLKALSVSLHDKNDNIIINAIQSLRNENPFYGAIQLLAETFDRSDNPVIKNLVRNFMNDIKDSGVRGEVIAEIMKNYSPGTIGMLVSSCWQSGLDYTEYAHQLTTIFIKYDYEVAIECFTVIEESAPKVPAEVRVEMISLLKEKAIKETKEKATLTMELIAVLS